ncbi:CTNND1 [Cervus elaphus hippelaphus]|uniref:CTNND1 n=1 Tax=Cervus elaphus hippelaphus TaxID=46360 RepID=A0A212DIV7_CEREH|nr:CTNND1 [Cervus elaphus hippelaphus]
MDDSEVESPASILASVKEQEAQFEKLTRALEEERRHVSAQLERVRVSPQDASPLLANGTLTRRHQNGRFVGDADLERQKFSDLNLNGPQDHSHLLYSTIPRMQEPGQIVETYTEEDPEGAMSVVSVETSDDGTTRRTETTVKKVVKTVTTRTVQPVPMGPDGLPVDASSLSNSYIQTLGRDFRKNGNGGPGPYVGQAGTATLPRNFHYPPDGYSRHYEDGYPGSGDNYGSLSRVTRIEERYRPSMEGYRAPSRQDVYGPQPQEFGLGDKCAFPDFLASALTGSQSYEDMIGEEVPSDQYYWAPLAQHERGSLASLDSLRKGGPPPPNWRQPELPEVIAMLGYRLDAVKSNAAAYLQHLCYRNDKVKTDVRKLKGIPVLDNKIAIKNCDGVPALVRLLRKARDMDLTETYCLGAGELSDEWSLPGTLWNLSSHDSIKMEIVDHALHALTDEVIIPHSGWEREPGEDCKPRHIEWESVLTNTAGCLRNVSSERSEARRKLRECDGLVDALIFIVQAEIGQKDSDSKLVENCVCLLRNLSYQVHREIPQAERYQEAPPNVANNTGPHAASCFGAKKGKGKHAIPNLVKNLPGGQQSSSQNFSEDTVVSILNTINEVIAENLEAAKKLRETQGIEKLVLINKSGNRSEKEVRAAALVLQTIWGYKELRKPLEKEGWKKSDFQVNLNNASRSQSSHSYDDSTLPLIDRSQKSDKKPDREEIQMSSMGSNTKSLAEDLAPLYPLHLGL